MEGRFKTIGLLRCWVDGVSEQNLETFWAPPHLRFKPERDRKGCNILHPKTQLGIIGYNEKLRETGENRLVRFTKAEKIH